MRTRFRILPLVLLAATALAPAAKAYTIHTDYKLVDEESQDWLSGKSFDMNSGASAEITVAADPGQNFIEWRLYYTQAYPPAGTAYDQLGTDTTLNLTYDSKFDTAGTIYTNIYLKPCFSSWKYTVDYDTNQGQWNPAFTPTTGPWKYASGGTFPTKDNITRLGYTLSNWTISNKAYSPGSAFTGDSLGVSSDGAVLKPKAQWSLNKYGLQLTLGTGIAKIYYKINGSASYASVTATTTVQVDYGTKWYAYAEPSTGYTCTGAGSSSGSPASGDMGTEGAVFAPVATLETYTVTTSVAPLESGSVSVFPNESTYTVNTKIEITATPNAGYAFSQWKSTIDPKTIYENPHTFTITRDSQFQACFTNRVCLVTFDPMGGTCSETSRAVTYGENVGVLPKAQYGAREFKGWYNDEIEGSKITQDTAIDGDKTFYAHWGPAVTYMVTTVASPVAGGSVSGGGSYASGEEITLTATPNPGYSFEKWLDDGTQSSSRQISVTGDATYTASFTGNVYNAIFVNTYTKSGKKKTETEDMDVKHGEPFGELPEAPEHAPDAISTMFVGWFDDNGTGEQILPSTVVAVTKDDYQFYAHWAEPAHCYVRFDKNGATSGEMDVQEFTIGEEQALSPNQYDKTGYEFAGWATNSVDAMAGKWSYADGETAAPFPEAKENETNALYATWKVKQYPLEIQPGAGVDSVCYVVGGVETNTSTNATVLVDYGAQWTAYAWAKAGYTLTAATASISKPAQGTMTTAGAVFAPQATPNMIKVTYNGNDYNGGSTAGSSFSYDTPGNLTSNGFSRIYAVKFFADEEAVSPFATSNSVYSFVGWNDQCDGKGVYSYGDGAMVSNACGSTGGTVTLYAQWTTNAASVVILPVPPEKAGNTFGGWYEVSGATTNRVGDVGDKYVPTANTTLVGNWSLNTYSLTIAVTEGIDEIAYATELTEGDGNPDWDWHVTNKTCTIDNLEYAREWRAYVSKVRSGYTYTEYNSEKNYYTGKIDTNESQNIFAPVATKNGTLTLTPGTGIQEIRYSIASGAEQKTSTSKNITLPPGTFWTAYAVANVGYATNATCAASGTMTSAGAKFAPSANANAIRVIYDSNGATGGAMADSSFTYDQAEQLPDNGYTRAYTVTFDAAGGTVTNASGAVMSPAAASGAYQFNGWATNAVDAAAGIVAYTDGQSVKNLSTGADVTLYAVWTTNGESVVTLPGAMREEYTFMGWRDATGVSRPQGYAFVPTNDTTFAALWKLEVGELSEAVGLTNAVLKAIADGDVHWAAMEGTSSTWDSGHARYVRLINDGPVTVSDASPLRLYLKLEGSGRFSWRYYKDASVSMKVMDICTGKGGLVSTNNTATLGNASWVSITNQLESGSHEIQWIIIGELGKFTDKSKRIALDNMTWTPDGEQTTVKPGDEPVFATEDAALAAAESAVVTRPNAEVESVISAADYDALFTHPLRVVQKSKNEWTMEEELCEAVSNAVQAVLDQAVTNLLDNISICAKSGGVAGVTMLTQAGLYYGIAVTNEIQGLKAAAPTNWVLGIGNKQELKVAVPPANAGFFELRAKLLP